MFAIKACDNNGTTVGHLPREISGVTKYILDRGATVTAELTSTDYRRSPLIQGELEIACNVMVNMPSATMKYGQIINKYAELVNELYSDPIEEVLIGSFLDSNDELLSSLPVVHKRKLPRMEAKK